MKAGLIFTTVLAVSAATARAEVTVQPIGLCVGSPMIDTMDFNLRPNGVNAGTNVHVMVSGFDRPVVLLDNDNSTLDKVTDSTGKDLLQERPANSNGFTFSSSPIGPFPKISEDGTRLIVDFSAPQAPAKGATGVTLEGTLSVVVATGTKVVRAEGVTVKPGQVTLGEHSVEVTGYGPSDWEEGKYKLDLKMTSDLLDSIKTWKITAPDGTELSDGPNSTMTMMNTAQLELTLVKKTDTFNIELELYDGMQKIVVPVNAEVGLGIE